MNILKGLKRYVAGYYDFCKTIEGMNPFVFIIDGIWCWFRYGCVFNQYTEGGFYKYRGYHRKKILTYRNWKKIIKLNDPTDIHYFKNKVDFNIFYRDFVGREWLYSETMTEVQFYDFVSKHDSAIIKPIDDWEGNGVELLEFVGKDVSELFNDFKSKKVLIEEVVKQHPLMVFNNKSVNTIRVYSIYDDAEKKAYIIKTTLRAGVGASVVDNSHSGGCSYEIDIESGRIVSRGWSHTVTEQIFHPGSDICMLGREIPLWKEAMAMVKRAAEMIPSVKYIGWDVAISENGPLFIEGNHDPDLDIMEFVGNSGYLPIIKRHLKF